MKILMIEDQRHFAEMIVHGLEGLDIEVVESLGDAQKRLNEERYDLVFVDLGLPDSQGMETLRALRGYKIPKVVLTGRFDIAQEAAQEPFVQDFVVKTEFIGLYERLLFNVAKVRKTKKPRFEAQVFEQIRACFEQKTYVHELTVA